MTAVCITNSVPHLRSCTIPGEHLSNCDGWARRYIPVEGYDKASKRTTRSTLTVILAPNPKGATERDREGTPCRGCMPRPAHDGSRLCEYHIRQVESAINELPDLITHLWSLNGSAPTGDGPVMASGFGPRWTLTDSRVTANQIMVDALTFAEAAAEEVPGAPALYLHPYVSPFHGFRTDTKTDLAAWIAREVHGWISDIGPEVYRRRRAAEHAVIFAQTAGAAFRRFPTEDHAHRIPILRCRTCGRMSLEWRPPLYYLGDDSIQCSRCGSVEDRSLYEHDVAVILQSRRRKTS